MLFRGLLTVLVLLPASAFAQADPGPFGGLFGRTPERVGNEFTSLDFRAGVGGLYDDAVFTDVRLGDDWYAPSGTIAGVNAGLTFARHTDRTTTSLQSTGTYQEYYQTSRFGAMAFDADAMFTGKLTTRLLFEGSAGYTHSPFYHLQPTVGLPSSVSRSEVAVPVDAFAARALTNDTYDATVGFSSQYSRRSSISASVSRRETRFRGQPQHNFFVNGAQARWSRRMTREVSIRLGYVREQVQQRVDEQWVHERIELGLDAAKQFSIARRTALGFDVDTTMLKERNGPRRYRVNGGIELSRGFARTWSASVGAQRNTDFLPGFFEPLFSDSINASIGGMVSKRAEWFALLGVGRGYFGFNDDFVDPDEFLTGNATTRFSIALARHLGLFTEYTFYYYDVPPGSSAIVIHNQLRRQVISVGLTTWIPIINEVRTPRDTR
jgi:hypothetical protein